MGQQMMNEKLKPCPFCGREIELQIKIKHGGCGNAEINIKCKCGLETPCEGFDWIATEIEHSLQSFNDAEQQVIEFWNSRI